MNPIRRLFIGLVACLVIGSTAPATAQSLAKLDPRALGMGGAYVAVAEGWAALQWNPAGLFASATKEVAISGGNLPLEGGEWVESLRALRGLATDLTGLEASALVGSMGAGLAGERSFGVYLASIRWGLAFQQVHYADELAAMSGSEVDVDTAALRTREYLVAMAQPIAQGRVIFGGSLKIVGVETRASILALALLPESSLTADDLLARAREGDGSGDRVVSADLGILLIPSYRFRLGAVVKNLNAPDLDLDSASFTRLRRQIRVGGMVRVHRQLKLSADLDLYSEPFTEGGRDRSELAGGLEWDGSGVALRAGLMFDLEAVERTPLYALGLGLRGESWRIDGAGTYAADRDGFGWAAALAADW